MTRDNYYLDIAYAVAKKSPCLKKMYGAVIVKNNEIISTGYNGPPRGEEHCKTCSKAHIDAQGHEKDFPEYLSCRAVHAEMNAIISAARRDMIGSTLYLAGWDVYWQTAKMMNPEPCKICERLIKNAGIKQVITEKGVIYENKNIEI